jgi:hypothetical protein
VCRRRVAFSLRQNLLLGFKTSASGVLAYAGRLRYGLLDPALEGLGQVPRWLGRADHYERGRGGADPAVAGKARRGRAEDFSGHLIVQHSVATETLNRSWYERNTGRTVTDVQRWVQHPVHRYLAAALDGFVNELDAVFEAKFMLPWVVSPQGQRRVHGPGLPRPSSRPPWLRR